VNGPKEGPPILDCSLSTLTTTDYGVIVPREYLARILTNLETVADQFCLAMTAARLVTLKPQADHHLVRWVGGRIAARPHQR
jgi:hypothetical protein